MSEVQQLIGIASALIAEVNALKDNAVTKEEMMNYKNSVDQEVARAKLEATDQAVAMTQGRMGTFVGVMKT